MRKFVTGMPKDAAGGVETYMCVPSNELHARIEQVRARARARARARVGEGG